MELKVWNKLLATGKVHDEVLTDKAMKQLRGQLVGAGVYEDYTGPRLFTIPYAPDDPRLREGRSTVLIGHVKAVEGDSMIIALAPDISPPKVGEEMIAKIGMVVTAIEGSGAMIIEEIVEVLGVCLAEAVGKAVADDKVI